MKNETPNYIKPQPGEGGKEFPRPMPGLILEQIITGLKDEVLGYPVAVRQDAQGNIYILDIYSTDGLVKIFDHQGNFNTKSILLMDPESDPCDLAIDGEGHIYIADLGLRAVLKYRGNKLISKIMPDEEFYPRSISFDSSGNLLVLSFDKIFKFNIDNEYKSFGKSGDAEGEFGAAGSEFYVGPNGLFVDKRDNIYVADTLNNRIQKFDSDGKFLRAFSLDKGVFPINVTVDPKGNMNVITYSGELLKLSSQGVIKKSLEVVNSSTGSGTYCLAQGNGDTILIAVPEKHQIKVFSDDGELYVIEGNTDENFLYPNNIEINQDSMIVLAGEPFCCDVLNNRVMMFNKKGEFQKEILPGYRETGFFGPKDATFIQDKLYLLDLDMISIFDSRGNFISSFGGRGQEPGDLGIFDNYGYERGPGAINRLSDSSLLLSDTFNNRLQQLSTQGEYEREMPMEHPGAMTLDKDGNIYVILPRSGKVQKYSPQGVKLLEFGEIGESEGQFTMENDIGISYGPEGIAVDKSTGNIYISDTEGHRILVFDKTGQFVKSIGGFGAGRVGFHHPRSLSIEDGGSLWVADSGNHRLVKINMR